MISFEKLGPQNQIRMGFDGNLGIICLNFSINVYSETSVTGTLVILLQWLIKTSI